MSAAVSNSAKLLTVAVIGNPNTGKSTFFTALTGIHSQIGNYPGVTVEKKVGHFWIGTQEIRLVDLPGTYSLSPRSLDELVSVEVLLGRQPEIGKIDAVVCIADASNLERNLYLFSQILDLGIPTVLVLNMWDVAASRQIQIDVTALSARLGLPVIPCEAHRHKQIDAIKQAIVSVAAGHGIASPRVFPEAFYAEGKELARLLEDLGEPNVPFYVTERLLLDVGGQIEASFTSRHPTKLPLALTSARDRLKVNGIRVPAAEAKARYAWTAKLLDGIVKAPAERPVTASDRWDRLMTHKIMGPLVFLIVMFIVFQSISRASEPLMELCESGQQWVGNAIGQWIPRGPFRSLVVNGVIAGVGGVLVFLPQICLLFFFIALLEDCGYMARAAFLMDKLMTKVGLSGKSFVPLMSSFACAIPGIMATRTIENRRDRMVTMLVAPLMSCSARFPVYSLMIAAFFPDVQWAGGWISLRGVMIFVMTFFGAIVAIPVAWLLKKTLFCGETPPFVMELPAYKWPSAHIVLHRVYDRAMDFVVQAGTLIFATSVLIWSASYFPGDHRPEQALAAKVEQTELELQPAVKNLRQLESALSSIPEADSARRMDVQRQIEEIQIQLEPLNVLKLEQNQIAEHLLETSLLGRFGKAIERAVRPLGWDWRIGVGVIASFPAREVLVSTLGTIYSLGSGVDEADAGLQQALKDAKRADGRPVYSLSVALSIMVFFALCAQCASTLMVIRRETNSWRWPLFTFGYMTTLAYIGALITYQIGSSYGW